MQNNLRKYPKYPLSSSRPKDNTIALYGLIWFNCLVFVWLSQDTVTKYQQFSYTFYRVVKCGEWYRLLTAGFLHGSLSHLIGNMVFLLVAGSWLCQNTAMSNKDFFVFYISSIVFSLLGPICTVHKDLFDKGMFPNGIGASGAVNAIVCASLLVSPRKSITYTLVPFAYFFYKDYINLSCIYTASVSSVHLGGIQYGLVYVIIFYPHQLQMTKGHRHHKR